MSVSYRLSWKEVVMPAVDLAKKALVNVSSPTGLLQCIISTLVLLLYFTKTGTYCK